MSSAYAGLKFNAVIDWVEVRIKLHGQTQFRHVQGRLESSPAWGANAPYVREERIGGRSLVTFRVQDPAGPADVLRRVQSAACPGTPTITEDDIEVVGMEVALDLYSAGLDRNALVDAALHMYRHHARPPAELPGGWPRIAESGRYRAAADVRDVRAGLADGWTVNAGHENGAYRARYYVKTSDTIDDESYATLPLAQHRARMEVTLQGPELPFSSMRAWRAFRFDSLASRFAMRRTVTPTAKACRSATPQHRAGPLTLAALLQAQTARFGVPANASRLARHKRTHRAWTSADTAWANRARDALRRLTRAQRRA